jgi:hypothetical protein
MCTNIQLRQQRSTSGTVTPAARTTYDPLHLQPPHRAFSKRRSHLRGRVLCCAPECLVHVRLGSQWAPRLSQQHLA